MTRGGLGNQPDTVRVLTLYADPRAWKGRAGLSDESRAAVAAWDEATQGRSRVLILCGSPDLVAEVPPGVAGFVAWGGEPLMQEAAARHLAQGLH